MILGHVRHNLKRDKRNIESHDIGPQRNKNVYDLSA